MFFIMSEVFPHIKLSINATFFNMSVLNLKSNYCKSIIWDSYILKQN